MITTAASYLFKTPLDENYENVFDSFNDLSEYSRFLHNNYDNKYVTSLGGVKRAVKTVNGNCKITIPFTYDEIKDYNYIEITNEASTSGVKYTYFFIIDITSENDNENNGSCTLTLKYDSWANNYSVIKTNKKNSFISRMTVDEHYINEDGSFMAKPFLTDEANAPTTIKSFNTLDGKQYKILWMKVKILKSDSILINNSFDFNSKPYTSSRTSAAYYTVFYPLAIINMNSIFSSKDTIIDKDFIYTSRDTSTYTRTVKGADERYTFMTNDVISASLTLNAPFSYNYTGNYMSIYANNYTNMITVTLTDGANTPVVALYSPGNTRVAEGFIITYSEQEINKLYTVKPNELIESTNGIDYDVLSKVKGTSILRLEQYPYKYRALYTREKEIPLIGLGNFKNGTSEYEYQFLINTSSDSSPFIQVKHGSNVYTYSKPLKINSNGSVVVAFDNYTQYMRTNANSIQAQQLSLIANGIAGAVSNITGVVFNPSSISGAVQSTIKGGTRTATSGYLISQKLEDLKNAPDVVSINGDASDYLTFQDYIYILTYDLLPTIEKDRLENHLHENGYAIMNEGNPISINRSTFDYCETDNAHLNCIKNLYQRKEIESALNRGMTRWHIFVPLTHRPQNYYDYDFLNFIKSSANYDISTMEYRTAGGTNG